MWQQSEILLFISRGRQVFFGGGCNLCRHEIWIAETFSAIYSCFLRQSDNFILLALYELLAGKKKWMFKKILAQTVYL